MHSMTEPLCIYILTGPHVFAHVRAKAFARPLAPQGFSLQTLYRNTLHSPSLTAGTCGQSSPDCTMTQEFTLHFHQALPWTAAPLIRARRFNYWPISALKPHQLSHTGNCLLQCKGGNWITGLGGKMYTHCSFVHLIIL